MLFADFNGQPGCVPAPLAPAGRFTGTGQIWPTGSLVITPTTATRGRR